ncbi:magnesium transporter [Edwardsiella hoshinae]|uniref:Magnesium transporter mgtE n=1 Tax=Edwardsiella hoshinae TaxID=93378 RepID=A0A376DJV9_9GAMM|nr:magnesium transporter [Edwardsiella hoshinae]QPR29489.1 magnesium transporter [Edwardsiella hoshinae]STC90338.1 Magnesium transporter mgtE [Edwardsiella hoshinae]
MSVTVTPSAASRAQMRARILHILLNEQAISDGLLGRLEDPQLLADPQLLDESAELKQSVRQLSSADLSDVLAALPCDRRLALWSLLNPAQRAAVLADCDPCLWPELTATLSDKHLLQMLQTLPLERRVMLGRQLPRALGGRLLTLMEGEQRNQARTLLSYAPHSVGALMTLDSVAGSVRRDMPLLLLLQWLRQQPALPTGCERLWVTDERGRLCGELPLGELLAAAPDGRVADLMQPTRLSLHPSEEALDAYQRLLHEHQPCAPVVDEQGYLLGHFSLIQASRYQQRQQERTHFQQAGLRRDEDLFAPITRSLRDRALPLLGIVIATLPAALLAAHFSSLLARWPMLALLMPLLMLLGSNTARQSAAVTQRALRRHHLPTTSAALVLVRELGVALLGGLIIGSLLGLVGGIYYRDAQLASLVVLLTVLSLMLCALLGVELPRLVARLRSREGTLNSTLLGALAASLVCALLFLLSALFLI